MSSVLASWEIDPSQRRIVAAAAALIVVVVLGAALLFGLSAHAAAERAKERDRGGKSRLLRELRLGGEGRSLWPLRQRTREHQAPS